MAFWIAEIFILVFCLTSYYSATRDSSWMRVVSFITLSITSVLFSMVILRIIFSSIPEFPTISALVISKVNPYFENLNSLYSKRGIWWSISPELYLEMKIGDDDQQEVIDEEESDEIEHSRSHRKSKCVL